MTARILPIQAVRNGDDSYIKYSDGSECYFRGRKLHRDDGPAHISRAGETWYHNGTVHRTYGPAIIMTDGTQIYMNNGFMHREDGPAKINADGECEYWWKGGKCPDWVKSDDELQLFLVHES